MHFRDFCAGIVHMSSENRAYWRITKAQKLASPFGAVGDKILNNISVRNISIDHYCLPASLVASSLKAATVDSKTMAQCVQCVPPCIDGGWKKGILIRCYNLTTWRGIDDELSDTYTQILPGNKPRMEAVWAHLHSAPLCCHQWTFRLQKWLRPRSQLSHLHVHVARLSWRSRKTIAYTGGARKFLDRHVWFLG